MRPRPAAEHWPSFIRYRSGHPRLESYEWSGTTVLLQVGNTSGPNGGANGGRLRCKNTAPSDAGQHGTHVSCIMYCMCDHLTYLIYQLSIYRIEWVLNIRAVVVGREFVGF
jgi:hypothetical protein